MRKILQHFYLFALIVSCSQSDSTFDEWQLLGFQKMDSNNPILMPDTTSLFVDPIINAEVKWEGKDVFNPSSVVRNDTLFLLYRAEDFIGKFNGTSRIGLAYSFDGINFERMDQPVFYPDNDSLKYLEWEGGAEDPRIVEDENGTYYMTYTAYDGNLARLLIASSENLVSWQKHGSVFENQADIDTWSKSGSIVCKMIGERMVASKINGKYWMYFGDTNIFLASSDDLIRWQPLRNQQDNWLPVLKVRKDKFDSDLVEPGPPAIITGEGILLIYNSKNKQEIGDPDLPNGTYSAAQALFDLSDPKKLMKRSDRYFFYPTKDYEITGQVNNVCFVEGLSYYNEKWFLYYGTADSKIAVAVSEASGY